MMMASMVPFAVVPPAQDAAAAGLAALGLAGGSSNAPGSGFAQVLNTALSPMPSTAKAGAGASFEPGRAAPFDLAASPGMALDTALVAGAATIAVPPRPQFDSSAVRSTLLSSASAVPVALDGATSAATANLLDSSLALPPTQPQPAPVAIDLARPPVAQAQAVASEADGLHSEMSPKGVAETLAPKPTASQPQFTTAPTKPRQEPFVGTNPAPAVLPAQPKEALEANSVTASPAPPKESLDINSVAASPAPPKEALDANSVAASPARPANFVEAKGAEVPAERKEASAEGMAGQESTRAFGASEKLGYSREAASLAPPAQPQIQGNVAAPVSAPMSTAAATAQALQPEPEVAQAPSAIVMASNEVSPAVKGSERRVRRSGQAEFPDTAAAPKIVQSADAAVLQPAPLSADPTSSGAAATSRPSNLAHKPEELGQNPVTTPPAAPVQGAIGVAAPTGNGALLPEAGLPSFEPTAEPEYGAPAAPLNAAAASASGDPAMPAPVRALREPTIVARPGQIGRDMGIEIARRVASGGDELVVRLNPQDLGRIEVRMSFDEGGSLRAVMTAESQTALDMLRREAADLGRALADAGVRADTQSLKFGAREGESGSSSWQRQHQDGGRRDGERHPDPHSADTEEVQYRPLRSAGQIDLMA